MGMAYCDTGNYCDTTTTTTGYYDDTVIFVSTGCSPDINDNWSPGVYEIDIIKDLSWYRKFDPVQKKDIPHKLKSTVLVKAKPLRLCARNI